MTGHVSFKNWNLFEVKKNQEPHPQNRIMVALKVLLKISDDYPGPFYVGASPASRNCLRKLAIKAGGAQKKILLSQNTQKFTQNRQTVVNKMSREI